MSKRKPLGVPALIKKLDRIFSVYTRLKDADENGTVRCCTCDKLMFYKECHAGHWIKRQHQSVRYDERNVHAQCVADNLYHGGKQDEYAAYVLRRYGQEAFDELLALKRMTKKWTRSELESLINEYSMKAKEMEAKLVDRCV